VHPISKEAFGDRIMPSTNALSVTAKTSKPIRITIPRLMVFFSFKFQMGRKISRRLFVIAWKFPFSKKIRVRGSDSILRVLEKEWA